MSSLVSSDSEPTVRFDTAGGRSFTLTGYRETLVAGRPEDVPNVLRCVEAAAADGLHAAGFVTYEAAPAFDPAFRVHDPDSSVPLARFSIFGDRHEVPPPSPGGSYELGSWQVPLDEAAYEAPIARIREWIAAGDTYQVNFTFPLTADFRGDPAALYADLLRNQRAGYAAYLDLGDMALLSISPELFFRRQGDRLELRPMKGTRPRGRWTEEDDALAAELTGSAKDRAENLMIVDLLRNDAGRVADFGTVEVPKMFNVERYPTVHQMTSTVRARLRSGAGLTELFGALFPCGSVTGAPKVRTMQIIRDMESGPRGLYTGAVGFVSGGEAVFNVAIRTLVVDRRRGRVQMGVGSGITHESRAKTEYRECLDKAAFVHRASPDFELLETMLWEPGDGTFLLDGHLRRLGASARYFGFTFDAARIRRRLDEVIDTLPDAPHRLRLLLSADGAVRVEHAVLLPHDDTPPRLGLSSTPVDSGDPMLYHKTTHRTVYERAAAERPDCDDVLLVNERGELTESIRANLVIRVDGRLWTPPLACGLLPGVLRNTLLAERTVAERVLRPKDVASADGVWLVNSVRRWQRARWAG